MAIIRWDPLRDLIALQERMNKLFEDSLSKSSAFEEGLAAGAWTPSADIYETPEKIVIKVDLPGMTQEEIMERYPEEYTARLQDLVHRRIEGGESFRDVHIPAGHGVQKVHETEVSEKEDGHETDSRTAPQMIIGG